MPSSLDAGPCHAPSHLGAKRGLFVEIPVHEVTVLPRGDLTAGGTERRVGQGPEYPCPQPASLVGRWGPCFGDGGSGEGSPSSCSHHRWPQSGRGTTGAQAGWRRGHRKLQAGSWPAHLPLVSMQQGRPLILQSMCGKPVRLLLGCSVQIWGGGHQWQVGLCGRRRPLPALPKPLCTPILTGHLVMSSGQMWAPLEAGSSQVLEADTREGTRACGTLRLPHPPANNPGGGKDHVPKSIVPTAPSRATLGLYLGSCWHTAPDVRLWPRPDLSMGGPVSSCHLTKVAKVSWRTEVG